MNLQFTIADIIFLGLILILAIRGGLKGFIFELFSIVVFFVAILIASQFGYLLGPQFSKIITSPSLLPVVTFLTMFVISFIILRIVAMSTLRILQYNQLLSVSSLLGFLLGIFQGILLCGFLIFIIQNTNVFNLKAFLDASVIAPHLERIQPLYSQASRYLG